MTIYFVVLVVFFFSALIFDNLPFIKCINQINSISKHIIFALKSKTASDYRKERLMKWYSLRLFMKSIKIAVLISVVFFTSFLLLYFASRFILSNGSNVISFLITIQGGSISILAFIVYYLFKRLYAKLRL